MEITFRTQSAASSIKEITKEFPEMKIGAGTLISANQIREANRAGAMFGLAPGFNQKVVEAARLNNLPFIPGISTPSEIEQALQFNCKVLKLFPVNHMGGTDYIDSLEGPYGDHGMELIPMSGVNFSNLKDYLQLRTVIALGGSWMAPRHLLENNQFEEIGDNVRRSLDIVGQVEAV